MVGGGKEFWCCVRVVGFVSFDYKFDLKEAKIDSVIINELKAEGNCDF